MIDLVPLIDELSNVKAFFSDLKFVEDTHSYFVNGKRLKYSVSGLIKKFVPYTDWDGVAERVAERTKIEKEVIQQEWKETADIACEEGTETHLFGEEYPINRKLKGDTQLKKAVEKFWNELPSHIIPLNMELKMYHKIFKFAGTMDLLLYNTKTKKLFIADYKGLPLDTDILTSEGWSKMEKLKIGDKVFDKEGKLCNVIGTSSIHNKKCLKIIFDNNEEIISDFEHRWLINKGPKECGEVMTTQEIKNYLDSFGKNLLSYQTLRILNPKPLNLANKDLIIDPYVFGVWLGDGHSIDAKITQANDKVWKEIENRGYTIGKDLSQGGAGKAQTRTVFNLQSSLKSLGLLRNKHLPEHFLLSSYTQRLDILRGLMDSDGYYNKGRKRFVLATTKKAQVDFSVQLLASLGIKPTVLNCNKYCNDKVIEGYDVCFTTQDFNPFLCRNEDIKIITNNQNKYRRIISVIEVDQVPTRCIEVDSESHTYLASKSLIVTHNTNKDLFKNFQGQEMLAPFRDKLDNPFNHYVIQLSFYQILLEQICKLEIAGRKIIYLRRDGNYDIYNVPDVTNLLSLELDKNYDKWHQQAS